MSKLFTVLFLLLFSASLFAGSTIEKKAKRIDSTQDAITSEVIASSFHKTAAGHVLGSTVYDYGTNSVLSRMMATSATGIHMVYMNRQVAGGDRFVTYDFFDLSSESFFGNQSLTEDRSTGWGRVVNGKNDEALAVTHGGGTSYFADAGEAFYSFTETAFGDGRVFPCIDRVGDVIVIAAGSDTLYISTDHGSTWSGSTFPVVPDTAQAPSNSEQEVLIDPTDANHFMSSFATEGSSDGEGAWIAESNDGGATWTYTQVIDELWNNGTQYFVSNFGQYGSVFDAQGTFHAVYNGYGQAAVGADTAVIVPVLYWNDRDKAIVEVDGGLGRDTSFSALATGPYPGNGIGNAYPSIATNGDYVAVVWQKPETDESGNLIFAKDFPGDSTSGIFSTDIWIATSTDGGATFSAPKYLAGTTGTSETFPNLTRSIVMVDDKMYVDLLYYVDNSPGVSLFGEGSAAMGDWVYERIEVDFVTGIGDGEFVAQGFDLKQNFPNPFNPTTEINFTLKAAQEVTLEVFNTVGQKVAVLLNNQKMKNGLNKVTFNANGFASGVYYYTLTAGDLTSTKKMVLMK
ncbi:MAG: T9SS C-terminal target domain-containing protein [Calditrichaeota bacterium]|nr:MAG: T9SS C-terminal target domain-containing protein [Calditrichota bacterium]MBL1207553.1 T9SS C-terminal target domain-containing protein [Calditrichota bacterium]NOG47385.1 T9SS type A sorting domain-containing protein [Calditrichota bacterium]